MNRWVAYAYLVYVPGINASTGLHPPPDTPLTFIFQLYPDILSFYHSLFKMLRWYWKTHGSLNNESSDYFLSSATGSDYYQGHSLNV